MCGPLATGGASALTGASGAAVGAHRPWHVASRCLPRPVHRRWRRLL